MTLLLGTAVLVGAFALAADFNGATHDQRIVGVSWHRRVWYYVTRRFW